MEQRQEMRMQMSDRKRKCPRCRGTGTEFVLDAWEDAVAEVCTKCNGTGWVEEER